MATTNLPNRNKIIAVLKTHGMDAFSVMENGWDNTGYFHHDRETGQTEWRSWPDDTVYQELRDAWYYTYPRRPSVEQRATNVLEKYFLEMSYDDWDMTPSKILAEELVGILKEAGVRF